MDEICGENFGIVVYVSQDVGFQIRRSGVAPLDM
jgi:hypothetical protein